MLDEINKGMTLGDYVSILTLSVYLTSRKNTDV